MTTATLSSKYQIVIPKEVRKELGLTAGNRINMRVHDGGVELRKVSTLEEIQKMLKGMKVDDSKIRENKDRDL